MASIYISADRGDDATGDGSAANPYATPDKAIGDSGVASPGDTVYIEPGIYRDPMLKFGVSGSSGNPITVIGDGDGSAFSAAGYFPAKVGPVEIVGWSDDATPVTANATLATRHNSYVTVKNLRIVGSGCVPVGGLSIQGDEHDWIFEDVIFEATQAKPMVGYAKVNAGVTANITFRRCTFIGIGSSSGVQFRPQLHSEEWDMGYLFEDCEFIGGNTGINVVQDGGAGSFCGSGITAKGCTFAWISIGAFTCQSTTYTLTSPYVVRGCVFAQCNVGISSTDDSLVDEDYNKFACSTARTNTTAGANSTDGERISLSFNLERLYGGSPRPFLEPTEGSTLIGAAGYDSPTTTDLYNQARPDPPSIGAIERDTFDGGGDTIITNIFQVEA